MNKSPKSASAIFMYIVIGVMLTVAAFCFTLYYADFVKSRVVLWVGVVSFTVLYHFWLRILLGSFTRRLPIRYTHAWFRQRKFETRLYRFLRVRKWKDKVLTYDPDAFSMEKHTYEEIAYAMAKAETDHWINELLSLSTLLFIPIWGAWWAFVPSVVLAMLFDAQFIVVQRYHRPIILRVIARNNQRTKRRQ